MGMRGSRSRASAVGWRSREAATDLDLDPSREGVTRAFVRLWSSSIVVWILALASIAGPIRAAEIDSLTDRAVPLDDASAALERRLNGALEAGVARANQASEGCDEEVLYRELRRALATPFIGHVIAES